jgi:hypothetical protein
MADITSITFAFYGFLKEHEAILNAYFAYADKWDPPWELTVKIEDARVVILNLSSEIDIEKLESLKRELPTAEIIVFSSNKPADAKWHLERQPNGKVSIVAFSKLVLKISHTLKKNTTKVSGSQTEAIVAITKHPKKKEPEHSSISEKEEFESEATDMSTFFNDLDTLLDSKPNEKRKRFNE